MTTTRRGARERLSHVRRLVSETAAAGAEDNVPMMAAAVSYYLLLTIAPLALFVSAVVRGVARVTVPGSEGAATLLDSLARAYAGGSWVSVTVTLAVLVFGASGVFSQFVLAVSRMWKEPPRRGPVYSFVRRHGIAFVLLGVLALGLLVSLAAGAILSALVGEIVRLAAELGVGVPALDAVMTGRVVVDFLASFLLFLTAFTLVPAHSVRIRDAMPGAAVTAAAYALGQIALGVYLANSNRVALYGGLGALIAVLLWAYYSAMIALYGAELSRSIVLEREGRAGAPQSGSPVP